MGGIRSTGLPVEAQELLTSLALYKVRRMLNDNLRLRTACDLRLTGDIRVSGLDSLPSEAELLACVQRSIADCKSLFAEPPVTRLTESVVLKKKKDSGDDSDTGEND